MSRAVDEWIATDDNQTIPARVKVRVFNRSSGKCAKCGRSIGGSIRPAYDHIIPLIAGGSNRETNLQLLCVSPCHAEKTRVDVAEKSKVARVRAKHIGIKSNRKKIQSAPFRKSEPQHTATRPIERRNP